MQKRILSLLLCLVMVLGLLPTAALAAQDGDLGRVRVIVSNDTYSKESGAPWEGTLVDKWVDLTADSTMMNCVVAALGDDYEQTGAESGYISSINGLGEFDGGSASGWMGTLNDWFTNQGFSAFTVAAGTLGDGDEIHIQYTCAYGEDLGSRYGSTSKKLETLSVSEGTLSPAFDADTHAYTLTLDPEVSSVVVTPGAYNKNFQVRASMDGKEYKRTASIPVSNGTVITVKCGDPSWPSMSTNTGDAEVYTITVSQQKPVTTINVSIRAQQGAFFHDLTPVAVSSDAAEKYGYTDNVDGVSALDALVVSHELTFGDDFTPATAKDYLDVSSSGWISMLYGYETYASGFFVNQGYPNDGTPSSYGGGYNGTMVTDTALSDGDVVDFFIYNDEETYSDYYTWIDAPASAIGGEKLTVTVKGFYAVSGYLYKDAQSLKAAAKPLEGVQLAWVSMTGYITPIPGAITDENGQATFTVDAEKATGYLAAVSYEDPETEDVVSAIMNLSDHIYILSGKPVTISGLHNAQLDDVKVYTYTDGVKGTVDLLADQERVADGYKMKYETALYPGDYWVAGYDANGDYNGGIAITVGEEGGSFAFCRVYQIYATNSGWVRDTDYTVSYAETKADGTAREVEMGTANSYGTVYASAIFLQGEAISATLTPIGDKANSYLPTTVSKTASDTASGNALSLSASIPQGLKVDVTAPAGSTVTTGTFGNYYTYTFFDADSVEEGEDTVTAHFTVPTTSLNHFVRVQNPDGVTYWDFARWTTDQQITVTRDNLHMDDDVTSSTVYRFEQNVYDRAGLYLNINRQGYKNVSVGDSFELDAFRNWQAIESFSNAKIALPDMHYQVVDFNGNPSDVLTITPDAHNSSLATVTANKQGTALVLVTYDAMTHAQAQSSTASKVLSAIWPEMTGVFVVSVDADGTAIATNTYIDRTGANVTKDEQKYLDAEHDILFYLGQAGAEYTFTPEAGCTVTVARSSVDSAMHFHGFTSDGVTTDPETGAVTVSGLTTGRHILRIEKDGLYTYQVVTARGVSYDLVDAEGNVLPENTEYKPGDTVRIQFHNLVSPKEKLSGVYNQNFSLLYVDENGKSYASKPGSPFGVYDFSGNPVRQYIEITIPADWEGLSYNLEGVIKVGGFGGRPTHRGVSYTQGMGPQYGTSTAAVLSRLPGLTIPLEGYAATALDARIAALSKDVSLGMTAEIRSIRAAYDAMTQEQQAQVTHYEELLAAEEALKACTDSLSSHYTTTGDYMTGLGTPSVGSIGGEWMVLGLVRSGRQTPNGYYANVLRYVRENIDEQERLHRSKSTDNSRLILALTAIGRDVTDVDGHNLLAGLNEMDYIREQGINGPIWALIALDSHNYTPMGDVTREALLKDILDAALPGGGWALSGEEADPDMTAMALQALAPYYDENAEVKAAADKALKVLSDLQLASGGYGSWGTENSESSAQVLVALTALGIDPLTDARFIKNGKCVLDALASYAVTGGGFCHVAEGGIDGMATEQGYYALAAYDRYVRGKSRLYDMTGVEILTNTYKDVSETAYYRDAAAYLTAHGVLAGTAQGVFSPYETLTRGQLVTMLYRMAGEPEVKLTGNTGFSDVPMSAYYTKAVVWAAKNNIASGYADGTFQPNRAVNRQELVTFLYRYSKASGADTSVLANYSDGAQVSPFARKAMAWALENGLIYGTSADTLSPMDTATRAQGATILYRFLTAQQ